MTKQLHLCKGETDYSGKEVKEDRYIILSNEGLDLYGEHFTETEANDILSSYGTV